MITTAILYFVSGVLSLVFSPWPKVTELPSSWSYISDFFSILGGLNAFPVFGTIIEISVLVLSMLVTWQLVVGANWLYNKIRGSG